MILTLPTSLEDGHSPQWAALHLAIGLYVAREATLGQAAEVAGLSQSAFQRGLGERKIPINYTMENLAADIQTAT